MDSPAGPAALEDLKILVVDDEPMLRSIIGEFLALLNFPKPRIAGDGQEALQILREFPIDCMFSDIRMPALELEDLLAIIKDEFPALIVLATSGYNDFDCASNIINAGAHDFLGKPLNLDSLEIALSWIVVRRGVLSRAAASFGRIGAEPTAERRRAGLDEVAEILRAYDGEFCDKVRHSIRIFELVERLELEMGEAILDDLKLSALLHEFGSSHHITALCQQNRKFENREAELVRINQLNAGRMVANSLGRPEFNTIIGRHLDWLRKSPAVPDSTSPHQECATWLGLLNAVDGRLQARPDRPPIDLPALNQWLRRIYDSAPLPPVASLLAQWPRVEDFYRQSAGAVA